MSSVGSRLAGLLLLAGLLGCQRQSSLPARTPVSGHVSINGRPLSTGIITFIPDDKRGTVGPPASGMIDTSGHYRLTTDQSAAGDGAIIGFHRVRVIAREPATDPAQSMTASLIPARYGNETTSGLQREVKADGENIFDFDLVGPTPAAQPRTTDRSTPADK